MGDYLVKVISTSGAIRGYAAVTTALVNEAYALIEPGSLSGVMYGRALTGATLMGATLKGDQRIALKFEGNGPVGSLVVESDARGHVRGSISNPYVNFTSDSDPIIQLRKSIGAAGFLTVTKDLGLKKPYSGTVMLYTGEVGEDIAYYLTESEQIPSAVSVGVVPRQDGAQVEVAGGFLIQAIPSHGGISATDEANLQSITEIAQGLGSVTELLAEGKTPEAILRQLFSEVPFKELEHVPLNYTCGCSSQSLLEAMRSLGKDVLTELAEEEGETEVICQFCRKKYYYSRDNFRQLL